MSKIYFVRHQAGGVMHEYPFASEPTTAQKDAVVKLCTQRFGLSHPKTKEPYWARVEDVELLADGVPEIPEQGGETANVAGLGLMQVSGRGVVTPKAGE